MGAEYAVERLLKAFNWDLQTRSFKLNPAPGKIVERMTLSPDQA